MRCIYIFFDLLESYSSAGGELLVEPVLPVKEPCSRLIHIGVYTRSGPQNLKSWCSDSHPQIPAFHFLLPAASFPLPIISLQLPCPSSHICTSCFQLIGPNFLFLVPFFQIQSLDFQLPMPNFVCFTSHFLLPTSSSHQVLICNKQTTTS